MPREKPAIPVAFDMLFNRDVCVGSENKICFCNRDLWTALNDLPLLLSGLIFSIVCIGSVLGFSVEEIKCELAWKCCSKQWEKQTQARSGNIVQCNIWTKKQKCVMEQHKFDSPKGLLIDSVLHYWFSQGEMDILLMYENRATDI